MSFFGTGSYVPITSRGLLLRAVLYVGEESELGFGWGLLGRWILEHTVHALRQCCKRGCCDGRSAQVAV